MVLVLVMGLARMMMVAAAVTLTVVAAMYFIPSYALSLLAQRLEAGPERRAILAADTATATIAPAPASRPE